MGATLGDREPVPVEYSVAVDRYLAKAPLGHSSRRVYRISLASWAWPLVGKPVPTGAGRRLARPPIVPLALLDDDDTAGKLAAAVADRCRHADARTVSRELSALRGAVGWWQDQRWIRADPTTGLRRQAGQPATLPPLTSVQAAALFRLPAGLREQAFWHLLYDSGAPADAVLALDARAIDLTTRQARTGARGARLAEPITWTTPTSRLLDWLLAGRGRGPVFLTGRRAPARAGQADRCPLTGQARMSYRRAAEIFTGWTRPLDPAGRGWTLHQLSRASRGLPAATR